MTNYYVDLSRAGPGNGTSETPWNTTQFLANLNVNEGDTFLLRGSYTTAGSIDINAVAHGFNIKAWDLAAYGPWHIKAGTSANIQNTPAPD